MRYRQITTPEWSKSQIESLNWERSPRTGFEVAWSSDYGYVVMAEGVKSNGFATVFPMDGRYIENSIRRIIKKRAEQ